MEQGSSGKIHGEKGMIRTSREGQRDDDICFHERDGVVLILVMWRLYVKYSLKISRGVLFSWKPAWGILSCLSFPWRFEHRGREKKAAWV